MNDLQFILQEPQPSHHTSHYPRQDILRYTNAVQLVHTARVHVLHAVVDAALDEERAVKVNNLGCGGAVQDLQLDEDRVELRLVELESYFLQANE